MASPLADLMLNDRGFAFDPTSGETFQLSATGLRIVRLLQQGTEPETVLGHLLEEFEVDQNTAWRDVSDFMRSMQQLGWIRA
ncbi:MAG: PqqD family protein [Roseimicrobium sp.]